MDQQMYILRGQRTAIAGPEKLRPYRAVVGLDVGRLLRASSVANKSDKRHSVERDGGEVSRLAIGPPGFEPGTARYRPRGFRSGCPPGGCLQPGALDR